MADSELAILVTAKDMASDVLERTAYAVNDVADAVEKAAGKIRNLGLVFSALGAAGLKLTTDSLKVNATFATIGITAHMTTGEIRDLAFEITDATTTMSEATGMLDLFARAGYRTKEEMKAMAEYTDNLADALGLKADVVADRLIPILKTYNIELGDTGDFTDKLTWLVKNSMMEFDQLATYLNTTSSRLKEVGLTGDDVILMMKALSDQGLDGRGVISKLSDAFTQYEQQQKNVQKAQEDLQEAVRTGGGSIAIYQERVSAAKEALARMDSTSSEYRKQQESLRRAQEELTKAMAGGKGTVTDYQDKLDKAKAAQKSFYEILGISEGQVSTLGEEMANATGLTNEYADAANKSAGVWANFKSWLEDARLKLGTFLQPMESVFGAMTGLGVIMMGLSSKAGIMIARFVAGAAMWAATTGVASAYSIAVGIAAGATWLMTAAATALNAVLAFALSPIGLVIIAIGLLVAAGIALWKNWDKVVKFFKLAWAGLQIMFAEGAKAILKFAIAPFLTGIHGMLSVLGKVVGFFKKDWGDAISNAADSVTGVIDKIDDWTDSVKANAQAYGEQVEAESAAEEAAKKTNKSSSGITGSTGAALPGVIAPVTKISEMVSSAVRSISPARSASMAVSVKLPDFGSLLRPIHNLVSPVTNIPRPAFPAGAISDFVAAVSKPLATPTLVPPATPVAGDTYIQVEIAGKAIDDYMVRKLGSASRLRGVRIT